MRTRMRRAVSDRLCNQICIIHLDGNRIFKHRKRCLKRQVTQSTWDMVKPFHYILYIMPFVLTKPGESINGFIVNSPGTHTVFLNTPSGERKLPEYAYSQITTNLKITSNYLSLLSIISINHIINLSYRSIYQTH
jgi:hypothetical protein